MMHGDGGGSMKMDGDMDMGGGMGMVDGMDMSMDGMSMTFGSHWRGSSLLFSFWSMNNGFSYFVSLIIVALLCIFYEYLTAVHEKYDSAIIERQLHEKQLQAEADAQNETENGNCCDGAESSSDERTKLSSAINVHSFQRSAAGNTAPSAPASASSLSSHHYRGGSSSSNLSCGAIFDLTEIPIDFNVKEQLIRSFLYGARAFLSLCVMMIFMLMDVGLVLAIVVGYILGYFAFQKRTTIAANQHAKQYKAAGCH